MKKTLLSMMMFMSILGTQTISASTMENSRPHGNNTEMHNRNGQNNRLQNMGGAPGYGHNAHACRPCAPVPPPPPPHHHRPQGPHHRPTPPPPPPPPAPHHHQTCNAGAGLIAGAIIGAIITAAATR